MTDQDKRGLVKGGAFYYIDEQGNPSDIKLHEDLLRNEDEITQALVAAGVIRQIIVVRKKPDKK